MRENRTYGSEGGEIGHPIFPTPISHGVPPGRRHPARHVRSQGATLQPVWTCFNEPHCSVAVTGRRLIAPVRRSRHFVQ